MADYDTHNRHTHDGPNAGETANVSAWKSSRLPMEQAYDFATSARAATRANPAVNSPLSIVGRNDRTNVGYVDGLPGNVADSPVNPGPVDFVAFPTSRCRLPVPAFRMEGGARCRRHHAGRRVMPARTFVAVFQASAKPRGACPASRYPTPTVR